MAANAELLGIFREETNERLDRMVETLLEIESQGGGSEPIATLFRDVHSIKGNAGMLGFTEVQEVAHAMEDILQATRATGILDKGLISPLLAASDAIRDLAAGASDLAAGALAALQAADCGPVVVPAMEAGEAQQVEATNQARASDPASERELEADRDRPEQAARDVLPGPAIAERSAAEETVDRAPDPAPAAEAFSGPRSIRVDARKVDRLLDVVGETVLHRRRLEHLVRRGASNGESVEAEFDNGELLLDELQHSVTQMRTLPLSSITETFPRAVRDMAAAAGKQVQLTLSGTDTQLDRLMLDGISETIVHLVRNSLAHGIETPAQRIAAGKAEVGRLELRAEARGEWVAVSLRDDGEGVSPALLARASGSDSLAEVLAEAGLSTATDVTELSGRGVGFDAVKRHVESLGGSVEVESEPGRGTTVTMLLPLMLSLVRVLLIESRGQVFGVPLTNTVEVLQVGQTMSLAGRRSLDIRGESVPTCDISETLGGHTSAAGSQAVIVSASGRRVALTCDAILDEQEVVVKSLGPLLSSLPGYLGAAILADARIALIIDPAHVVQGHASTAPAVVPEQAPSARLKVLVVDDQFTVRELERSILEAAGYNVVTAEDGQAALDVLQRDADVALVLTDIEMPRVTGLELLAAIRTAPERPSLPVIVVTSRGDPEDRRLGAEAGADAYVVKSEFAQEGLLKIVRRLIDA
jgi:two-component system chemotaxis sensor kinase CheA